MQRYESSAGFAIRSHSFCATHPSPGEVSVLISPDGGWGTIPLHGILGEEARRCAFRLLQRAVVCVHEPSSLGAPASCSSPPTLHKPTLPTSFYSLSGWKPTLPSPGAWKRSSTRQLSVLKEHTDLTFLRSHRRLIS